VIEIRSTQVFKNWLTELRDRSARVRIIKRIDRLALGNPGHWRSVGEGVIELKIDYGPGYRVYYTARGSLLIVLLCGGDKSTQEKDIRRAKELAAELELEEPNGP
jgi:putative addiction module killer protein